MPYDRDSRQYRNRQPNLPDYRILPHGHTSPRDGGALGETSAPASSGGGGGGGSGTLGSVTDGSTTVAPAAVLDFVSGATVSDLGGGVAGVAVTGGMANPMTTRGDIVLGATGGTPDRLAAGLTGYVMTSNGAGNRPSWQASASGFSNPMTTLGDVILGATGGTAVRLARGTTGYVLTSQGSARPAWAAAGGGGSAKYPFGTNYFAETKPVSPNATYDDEFDDTSGMSGAVNGLAAKWAWRNQSTSTATFGKEGWLTISIPASGSASFRILEVSAIADGTYDTRVSLESRTDSGGDAGAGLVVDDATNGDFYILDIVDTGGSSGIYLQKWNSVTSWNSTLAQKGTYQNAVYFRFVKSGTAFEWWFSFDGIGFLRIAAATDSVSPTKIGLGVYETKSSGATKGHFDYFRKTA